MLYCPGKENEQPGFLSRNLEFDLTTDVQQELRMQADERPLLNVAAAASRLQEITLSVSIVHSWRRKKTTKSAELGETIHRRPRRKDTWWTTDWSKKKTLPVTRIVCAVPFFMSSNTFTMLLKLFRDYDDRRRTDPGAEEPFRPIGKDFV